MSSDFTDSDAPHISQPDLISESQASSNWLDLSRFEDPATELAEIIEPLPPLRQDGAKSSFRISYMNIHASPLMPLRTRDLQALTDLFHHDDIAVIEADIVDNLLKRSPTPAWEDFDSHLLHDSL